MSQAGSREHQEERVFSLLVEYFGRFRSELVAGDKKFTLNPSCLRVLSSRLSQFEEALAAQQRLQGSTYFNRSEQEEQIFREVKALYDYVCACQQVRIEPNIARQLDKSSPLDLSHFRSLRRIELVYCKPYLITNLSALHSSLQSLVVSHSLNSIAEAIDFESSTTTWDSLIELRVPHNNIPAVDSSLRLIPRLQHLDLSHNIIPKLGDFSPCFELVSLNLSFNSLASVANANRLIGGIKRLILRQNHIASTDGLDKLYALEYLDLAQNAIASLDEVRRIAALPCLSSLWLIGNPLSWSENYRLEVLVLFPPTVDGQPFTLDSSASSAQEIKAQRRHLQRADDDRRAHLADGADVSRLTPAADRLQTPSTRYSTSPMSSQYGTSPMSSSPLSSSSSSSSSFGGRSVSPARRAAAAQLGVAPAPPGEQAKKKKKKKKTAKRVPLIAGEGLTGTPERAQAAAEATAAAVAAAATGDDVDEEQMRQKIAMLRKEGGDRWLFMFNEWVEETAPKRAAKKRGKSSEQDTDAPPSGAEAAVASSPAESRTYHPQQYMHSMTAIGQHGQTASRSGGGGDDDEPKKPAPTLLISTPVASPAPVASADGLPPVSDSDEATTPGKPEWPVEKVTPGGLLRMTVHLTSEKLLEVRPPADVDSCPQYRLGDVIAMREQSGGGGQAQVVLDLLDMTSLTYAFPSGSECRRFAKELVQHRPSLARMAAPVQVVCPACRRFVKGYSPYCTKCFTPLPASPIAAPLAPAVAASPVSDARRAAPAPSPSADVVVLSPQPERMNSSSAPSVSKKDITDVAPEIYEDECDGNLLIVLQSSFLQGEKFVCLLRTSFLPFGTSLLAEKSVFVLLGVEHLWILKRGVVDGVSGFVQLHRYALASLVRAAASLFAQYFRLDFAPGQQPRSVVVLLRSHARTHRFLAALCRHSGKRVFHENRSTLRNLIASCLVGERQLIKLPRHDSPALEPTLPPVSCLILCFLRTAQLPAGEKAFQSPQYGYMLPRTLVITKSWLFLAVEDYAQYPLPDGAPEPATPQFSVVDHDSIRNIQAIEIDRDDSRTVTIIFASADNRSNKKWDLLMQTAEQQAWCVKTLSNLWFLIDRYPILVLTKE